MFWEESSQAVFRVVKVLSLIILFGFIFRSHLALFWGYYLLCIQDFFLVVPGGPYEMPGFKLRLATCTVHMFHAHMRALLTILFSPPWFLLLIILGYRSQDSSMIGSIDVMLLNFMMPEIPTATSTV